MILARIFCFITSSFELVHSIGNVSEILVYFKSKPQYTAFEANIRRKCRTIVGGTQVLSH